MRVDLVALFVVLHALGQFNPRSNASIAPTSLDFVQAASELQMIVENVVWWRMRFVLARSELGARIVDTSSHSNFFVLRAVHASGG